MLERFFNVDNPVWKFIGNLADFFLLSLLWFVCSLPVVTIGASTTALYYVTLKMAKNQEGKLFSSFFRSFKENFKQATLLWLGCLVLAGVLAADYFFAVSRGGAFGMAMLLVVAVIAALALCVVSFLFVLLARVANTTAAIFKMACAITIRNLLPVLSAALVTAAFFLVGVFLFWPVLAVTPGLPAYLNSFIYNRILEKYGFALE